MSTPIPSPKFYFAGPGRVGVLPTVKEMVEALDRKVVGQRQAKLDLATAVYNHYLLLGMNARDGGVGTPPRQNVMLLGPTGSGKTHLVRTLAAQLGVPFVAVGAHRYTAAGYVGKRVESILADLWKAASSLRGAAERGIVFIDEIDKICANETQGLDVSGVAVQNALLAILDGGELAFEVNRDAPQAVIDVSQVLFVCAGAFVGLPELIRERLLKGEPQSFGFSARGRRSRPVARSAADLAPHELMRHWENEDLRAFGLVPEFVGRFSTISTLSDLTSAELAELVDGVEGSPLREEQERFKLHGIRLEFERDAVLALAEQAARLGTGARGLKRALLRALDHVDYRLSTLAEQGIGRIVYSRACIESGTAPLLEKTDPPPDASAAARLRETAFEPAPLLDSEPDPEADVPGLLTDSTNMSKDEVEQISRSIERLVLVGIESSKSAQAWWERLCADQSLSGARRKLRVLEELRLRRATVVELQDSVVRSGSTKLRCILEHFDGVRMREWRLKALRAAEEGRAAPAPPPSWPDDPLRTEVIP
jgi:ATP-dependent Clp protease ATP-binding subunit ClpX